MTADELLRLILSQDGARPTVERSHIHRRGNGRVVGCDNAIPCPRQDGWVKRYRVELPNHGDNTGALYYSAWEADYE